MALCSVFAMGLSTLGTAYAAEPNQPTAASTPLTRVSINSADAATLAKHLVGIGPNKAEAIVQWRETHGRFTSVEQLLEIKGIGTATLNKNKERVTL